MKKAGVWTVLIAVVLAGCAAQMTRPTIPTIEDSAIISASFDKVWGAIVGTLAERALPIEAVEKESGLITTKFVTFTRGMRADEQIDRIAVKPSGLLDVWSQGRYILNIFVVPSGEEATKVKITTHIEAYERNVTNSWHICYSNGVLEREIFDAIGSQLNDATIKTESTVPLTKRGKIGIQIHNQIVASVVSSGPADQAGIMVGDKILTANGIELNGDNLHDADLFVGYSGTTVILRIRRDSQIREISVVRE